jgi:hypothetical protein
VASEWRRVRAFISKDPQSCMLRQPMDQDEVRRSLHAEEVGIVDEIRGLMLADDYEAVAIRRLQYADNSLVHDVGHSGAILGGFAFS